MATLVAGPVFEVEETPLWELVETTVTVPSAAKAVAGRPMTTSAPTAAVHFRPQRRRDRPACPSFPPSEHR